MMGNFNSGKSFITSKLSGKRLKQEVNQET